MIRTFEDKPAVREMTPLLIGLAGCSGSGKTYSALRLATGIQEIAGGEIYCIDTEGRRALHYAEQFKFRHVEFQAPFGPLDYLSAIEHCRGNGAAIIIVDSLSHEHEGPGGVLEMHQAELDRLEARFGSADKATFAAWQKPKSERRRLINAILQMPINFIFCFRAKEKLKLQKKEGKTAMVAMGWMPIAGEEFIYEMMIHCLLYPASGGQPIWSSHEPGERAMIKLPAQFAAMFKTPEPLSEKLGKAMALWASGGKRLPEGWHAQQAQAAVAAARAQEPETGPDKSEPCPVCAAAHPNCRACKREMLFRKSGFRQGTREVYPAFWACPNRCRDSADKRRNTNLRADEWHALAKEPAALTGMENL